MLKNGLVKKFIIISGMIIVSSLYVNNVSATENSESEQEGIQVDSYIIADSDSRYLQETELYGLPVQVLNYARNEIYARRGEKFKSEELQEYFEQQTWYSGTIQQNMFDDRTMLNQYEYANVQLLKRIEYETDSDGYKLDQKGYNFDAIYQYEKNQSAKDSAYYKTRKSEENYQYFGGNKVESVSFETEYADTEIENISNMYAMIKGLDADGNVIWQRKTDQFSVVGSGVQTVGEHEDRYYYEEGGDVVALDKNNGEIQWRASAGVLNTSVAFGDDGTLYIGCYEGIDFVAIDKNGNILCSIDRLSDEYVDVINIEYLGNQVAVTLYDETDPPVYLIDLSDFSYHRKEENSKSDEMPVSPEESAVTVTPEMEKVEQQCYEPSAETSEDKKILMKNINYDLNIRDKPCYNSSCIGTITDSSELYYYGKTEEGTGYDGKLHVWCEVTNESVTGWVESDQVLVKNVYYQKAIETDMNLRELPQHKSDLITVVTDDRPLYFYGEIQQGYGSDQELHDWYKVYLGNGVSGWARSDLIAIHQPTGE